MPTGYTAYIEDDISFRDFVLMCARAIDYLIIMRDDPKEREIPETFFPDDYYLRKEEKARNNLKCLCEKSSEEIKEEVKKEAEYEFWRKEDQNYKCVLLEEKYKNMLEKVKAWNPPTKNHEGLKKFMVEQIEDSIKCDCRHYELNEEPHEIDVETWFSNKKREYKRQIKYYHEEYKKEVKRTEERNEWMKQLKDSL